MSENPPIEWCDHTWNPWIGCTKVSPGCDNCYAEVSTPARVMKIEWGAHATRHRTSTAVWQMPLRWNNQHDAFETTHMRRQRVFCASLADVFDNAVDPGWRAEALSVMESTPALDWLVLTKRVGNVRGMIPSSWLQRWPEHVRLGSTIVNDEEALRDIPKLLALPAPNFLSLEPLLGAVNLRPWLDRIDWVITGGESGRSARITPTQLFRDIRDQCDAAQVPFLSSNTANGHRCRSSQLSSTVSARQSLADHWTADFTMIFRR